MSGRPASDTFVMDDPLAAAASTGNGQYGADAGPAPARHGAGPELDPVDIARLAATRRVERPQIATRWLALAVVVVLFVVLLIMGAWLAAHVHGSGSGSASPVTNPNPITVASSVVLTA